MRSCTCSRGWQWRTLPQEFGIGQRYMYGSNINAYLVCVGRVLCTLREAEHIHAGCKAIPSVAIIDLRSVKTTLKGGDVDLNAGKKIKDRKQHIAVDTMELLLA